VIFGSSSSDLLGFFRESDAEWTVCDLARGNVVGRISLPFGLVSARLDNDWLYGWSDGDLVFRVPIDRILKREPS
jgi:hypothetical protein